MNILFEQLPTAVEVDGHEYSICSDFRTGLRIMLAFEDEGLSTAEKQLVMLESLYPERPENDEAAFALGIRFLNGGRQAAEGEEGETPLRLYSFERDAELIFSAFRQTHGIDLETADMHWWKFLALFMDLGADTAFCNLVGLRKRVKTGKATKEERQAAREMGEAFDLPEIRTPEEVEREAEFMRLLGGV